MAEQKLPKLTTRVQNAFHPLHRFSVLVCDLPWHRFGTGGAPGALGLAERVFSRLYPVTGSCGLRRGAPSQSMEKIARLRRIAYIAAQCPIRSATYEGVGRVMFGVNASPGRSLAANPGDLVGSRATGACRSSWVVMPACRRIERRVPRFRSLLWYGVTKIEPALSGWLR